MLGAYPSLVADNAARLARISGKDEVSFHMSGTEAVMQAVRLARYHTKRSHLVRFCGAYHGWWGDVQPGIGNPVPAHDTYTLADMSERPGSTTSAPGSRILARRRGSLGEHPDAGDRCPGTAEGRLRRRRPAPILPAAAVAVETAHATSGSALEAPPVERPWRLRRPRWSWPGPRDEGAVTTPTMPRPMMSRTPTGCSTSRGADQPDAHSRLFGLLGIVVLVMVAGGILALGVWQSIHLIVRIIDDVAAHSALATTDELERGLIVGEVFEHQAGATIDRLERTLGQMDRHLALLRQEHVQPAKQAPAAREEHPGLQDVVRELRGRLGQAQAGRVGDRARPGRIACRTSSSVTFTSTVSPLASSRPVTIARPCRSSWGTPIRSRS